MIYSLNTHNFAVYHTPLSFSPHCCLITICPGAHLNSRVNHLQQLIGFFFYLFPFFPKYFLISLSEDQSSTLKNNLDKKVERGISLEESRECFCRGHNSGRARVQKPPKMAYFFRISRNCFEVVLTLSNDGFGHPIPDLRCWFPKKLSNSLTCPRVVPDHSSDAVKSFKA